MGKTNNARRVPKLIWRALKLPSRILYALGLGSLQGRFVLLLTTIGRKSGMPRVTPLQYEKIDGLYYVGSARGEKADWYRNILINPNVRVQVRSRRFNAIADPINDPEIIADFLELRLRRHPRMVGAMLLAQGYPSKPNRAQVLAYAAQRTMVVLRPIDHN